MQYIITDSSVIKLNETQGTIQNCGNSAIKVSNSADFSDSLLLPPQNKSTFTEGLYIQAYNEDTQPIEVNVVPFFFVSSGNGVTKEEFEQLSATSFKSAAINSNRVSFYTTSDTSGTAAFTFDFPEEMFLDQAGTELVSNFVWSALIYPGSTNPNLDGKTVLVLAVRGDEETNPTVKYSFVDLAKLIDISGKIDKVAGAIAGHVALLTDDGGIVDGGINLNQLAKRILADSPVRYGYRIKKDEPDPDDHVEYIFDAVGMTPAKMNFETGEFEYGSWEDVWFVKDNKPLMLKSDGTADYYLYENDYSIKANGSDVTVASTAEDSDSDVANASYDGNAMVQIPLCWVKRYEDDDYIYEIVSNVKWDEGYHAYAHTNANGDIKDYFYYSMFDGSGSATKIRSLKGKPVSNGLSAQSQVAGARANGNGWYIHCWSQRELIRTLCVLLGKSTNTQTVFGKGNARGTVAYETIATGTISDKGQFFGYSSITSAVKVFHIENFWGNQADRTAGLIMNYTDGYVYVKMTPEGEGYRFTDVTGMTKTSAKPAVKDGGYIKNVVASDQGVIPISAEGSGSTYFPDGYWRRSSSAYPSGNYGYLLAGGSVCNPKTYQGAFTFGCYGSPADTRGDCGCGLSYIG